MLRKLITQAISVAGIRVIGTGLAVLVSLIIARLYGADALGVYGYCIALTAIAAVPISNGWSTLILRTVSGSGTFDASARSMAKMGRMGAVGFSVLAGILGLVAVQLGRTDIALALQPAAFVAIGLLALALLADQVSAMRMATIRGLDRPALAQLPESIIRPVTLLSGLFAARWFFEPITLVDEIPFLFAALATAALISAIIGQVILSKLIGRSEATTHSGGDRKLWAKSAAALAGSAGLVQLNGYIDMLILGSYVTPADVGYYRASLQIAMLASFGYVALNMLAGQRFASFVESGDRDNLAKTARYLARLALVAAIPLPLILWVFGGDIFALLFGPDFAISASPALILAIGFLCSSAIGMARTLLVMEGKEFLVMRTTIAALTVNIVLCLILIPIYGIQGAAIANCTATVTWNLLLWLLARHQTGVDTSAVGLVSKQISN